MKRLLLCFLLSACSLDLEPLPPSDSSDDSDAGEQYIATGVGVVSDALTGPSFTKDKIKARYSGRNWVESTTELRGQEAASGCSTVSVRYSTSGNDWLQYDTYRKFAPYPCQPRGGSTAYSYLETIRCPAPNHPQPSVGCWKMPDQPQNFKNAQALGLTGPVENIIPTCTAYAWCAGQRAFIDSSSQTHWTWGNSCDGDPSGHWTGTAPGGRTAYTDPVKGDNYKAQNRFVHRSQMTDTIIWCTCSSGNSVSCHY